MGGYVSRWWTGGEQQRGQEEPPQAQEREKPVTKRVKCPYSPDGAEHYVNEPKLLWHILKCEDYKKNAHLYVVCPYDALHVFKKGEDMDAHIAAVHSAEVAKIAAVAEHFQHQAEENPWESEWPPRAV